MKKIFLILIFFSSFLFSEILTNKSFIEVAKQTNNAEFIKDANFYRETSLDTEYRAEDRKYINYLYSKYPEYNKLIYVNFDTNSKDINPFEIKKNDLKLSHSKYIILKSKKESYLLILLRYFGAISFGLLMLWGLLFGLLNDKQFRYSKIIISILFIVLSSIFIYLYNSVFYDFGHNILDNLDNYILIFGLLLTGILSYLKDSSDVFINGFVIIFSSYVIVSILSVIFL